MGLSGWVLGGPSGVLELGFGCWWFRVEGFQGVVPSALAAEGFGVVKALRLPRGFGFSGFGFNRLRVSGFRGNP